VVLVAAAYSSVRLASAGSLFRCIGCRATWSYAPGAVFATVAGCYLVNAADAQGAAGDPPAVLAVGCALRCSPDVQLAGERIAHGAHQRVKDTYGRIRQHLPSVRTITADPGDLAHLRFLAQPARASPRHGVPFPRLEVWRK
jgi:hypothetical protein